MNNLTLTEDQDIALYFIVNWLRGNTVIDANNKHESITTLKVVTFDNVELLTLSGSAGTGKTTLLKEVVKQLPNKSSICVTATTHKAKRVVQAATSLTAYTIQKLLGLQPNTELENFDIDNVLFDTKGDPAILDYSIVIIDEASMISSDLYDLIVTNSKKYGTKILFVGDEKQLPPIKEKVSRVFSDTNLIELRQIVRQSDTNPINEILYALRDDIENHTFNFVDILRQNVSKYNDKGEGYTLFEVEKEFHQEMRNAYTSTSKQEIIDDFKILAYTNAKVVQYNNFIKKLLFGEDAFIQPEMFLVGYNAIKKGYDTLIENSGEYEVISFYPDTVDVYKIPGIKVLKTKIKNLDNKMPISINILDITDEENIKKFLSLFHYYHTAALKGAWKAYYTFKADFIVTKKLQYKHPVSQKEMSIPIDLDLGFACTVHKSQGSTYDTLFINGKDLNIQSNTKELLQLYYVAISRTRKKVVILL